MTEGRAGLEAALLGLLRLERPDVPLLLLAAWAAETSRTTTVNFGWPLHDPSLEPSAAVTSIALRLQVSLEEFDPGLGRHFGNLWRTGDVRLLLTAGAISLVAESEPVPGPAVFGLLRALALQGLITWLEDEAGRVGGVPWEVAILASDCALAEWMTEIAPLPDGCAQRVSQAFALQRAARIRLGGVPDPHRSRSDLGRRRTAGGELERDLGAPGRAVAGALLECGLRPEAKGIRGEMLAAAVWLGTLAVLSATARNVERSS